MNRNGFNYQLFRKYILNTILNIIFPITMIEITVSFLVYFIKLSYRSLS